MREMKTTDIDWILEMPVTWNEAPNKVLMKKKKVIVPIYDGEDILSLTMDGVIVRDLEAGGKMPTSFDGYQKIESGNLLMCLFDYDVTPRCIGIIKQNGVTSPAYSQYVLSDIADANYYYYYYLMVDNTKELLHLAKNMRHSFSEEDFGRIKAPVPPINEQKRIANFLDTKCTEIDALVADIQSQIDTLEQYKRSIITEVVTKGLDKNVEMKESGIPWIGKIPADWKVHPVFFYFGERKNINRLGNESNLLSLSYGNVIRKDINTNGGLLPATFNTYNIVEPGDIIIRPTDLQNDKRSLRTGLVTEHGIITSAYIDLMPIRKLSSEYYHYLLHSYDIMKVFYNMGNGVRQGLNFSEFGKLKILEPPMQQQNRIATYLNQKNEKIDSAISDKRRQLTLLDSYKKSLIYEYVTGKKEVPNAWKA